MPNIKQLWILAGGNGSGKSTFYQQYLSKTGIKFVNADLIAREIDPDHPEKVSYEAATLAADIRNELLRKGVSFCFETVFSHESKIDFIGLAKSYGYTIILVYFHLMHPNLNEARVFQRTQEGGHSVPADKIRSRIPRTMKNVRTALTIVDETWILDNSYTTDRFKQIVMVKAGHYEIKVDPLPDWVKDIIPD